MVKGPVLIGKNENALSPSKRRSSNKKEFTVLTEGNIGCGKSTFLKFLAKSCPDVEVVPEPVNLWQNLNGENLLAHLYENPVRWATVFQSYVQLTMFEKQIQKTHCRVKILERSVQSARYCFVENMFQTGRMEKFEYAVLDEWFQNLQKHDKLACDLIVYLRADPETCWNRIKMRNRSEESNLSLDYVKELHRLHEDWLINNKFGEICAPILVVDVDKPLDALQLDYENLLPQIAFRS